MPSMRNSITLMCLCAGIIVVGAIVLPAISGAAHVRAADEPGAEADRSYRSFGVQRGAAFQRSGTWVETLVAVLMPSGAAGEAPEFILVNEDHDLDIHRYVSACLFARVAQRSRRPVVFAAETARGVGFQSRAQLVGGYLHNPGYREILSVAWRTGDGVFAYDPPPQASLQPSDLMARGVADTFFDARDRLGAERLASLPADWLVYVQVGGRHIDERVRVRDDGRISAWLAGHLSALRGDGAVRTVSMTYPVGRLMRTATPCTIAEAGRDDVAAILSVATGDLHCVPRARIGILDGLADVYLRDVAGRPEDICPERPGPLVEASGRAFSVRR